MNNDKMNKNQITNYIAMLLLSVLILTYSTVLQFAMPDIVLCFGEDGHVAFEQSDENCPSIDFGNDVIQPTYKSIDFSRQKIDCQDLPLPNVLLSLYLEKDGNAKTVKLTGITKKMNATKIPLLSGLSITNNFAIIHTSMKSLQATILLI